MADYGKLLSRIWTDPDFTRLSARSQQVYGLLISFSTRNYAGVLPLTVKRWSNCTADATIGNIADALNDLAAHDFVVVDWDSEEVLIRTYIRNDEIYRQPNLMKNALKFALQVQSPELRWALHDEFMHMPVHKDAAETERVANVLVDGLSRTPREPFPEPFPEPIPEPPGVGGTYQGDYTCTNTGHLHQHQQRQPFAEPIDAAAATSGADVVRRVIPREHPAAVQTALRIRASELINTGTDATDVEAALRLWLSKPSLGPNVLPSLVSEVIRARAAPSPNGRPHKLRGIAALAAQERAREQALETASPRKELE